MALACLKATKTLSTVTTSLRIQTVRNYRASLFLEDIGQPKVKYEVSKDPAEWKYVERLLPITVVPTPTPKAEYLSKWRPQGNIAGNPYAIMRTKNHMVPVYLKFGGHRDEARYTVIKRIEGDIWQLEKELRPFLTDLVYPKQLRVHVNEFAKKIIVTGDFVNAVKHWLSERNF